MHRDPDASSLLPQQYCNKTGCLQPTVKRLWLADVRVDFIVDVRSRERQFCSRRAANESAN